MKTVSTPFRKRREQGSILVICMVLAGIGTIGAAAFFSLIQAKSEETLERETALIRRVRLANSRAVAKEVILRQHLGVPTPPEGGARTFQLPDGWGEASISGHPSAPLASAAATRLHKTGVTPLQAFSEDIAVSLHDGNTTHNFQAQAKSWHPALGGDLLVAQRPTGSDSTPTRFSGNLLVKGRAVFHEANYAATASPLRADRVLMRNPASPLLSLLSTDGASILPDNGNLPATTAGLVSGVADFEGRVNLIGNPYSPINDYADFVAGNGGSAVDGDIPHVTCDTPATTPPSAGDGIIQAILEQLTSPLPSDLPAILRPYQPLSSQLLSDLIGRSTIADSTLLTGILMEHGPLPQDVLLQIANGTAPLTETDKWHLIRSNPVAIASDLNGTLYIDLDAASLTLVHATNIQTLILRGQEDSPTLANAAALAPVVVALQDVGSASLSVIQLEEANNRPLILAVRKQHDIGPVQATFSGGTAFPEWRAIVELEGVALNVNTSAVSAATLIGGIRTDRSIDVAAGTLTLEKETESVSAIQNVASRNAWLEMVNLP